MVTPTALWQAINAYDIDAADAALPFSRRLARETGWTHDFTLRAIAEYKAFMYLICVSDTMLTPSEEVDQVWHLHLIYTRDYWDRFCAIVLERRIHHGPTQGGAMEDARYLKAYERTRQLYAETFGRQPPPDLWPEPNVRFTPVRTPQIPDLSDKVILPKRQVFLCLIAGAAAFALTGCAGGSSIRTGAATC